MILFIIFFGKTIQLNREYIFFFAPIYNLIKTNNCNREVLTENSNLIKGSRTQFFPPKFSLSKKKIEKSVHPKMSAKKV